MQVRAYVICTIASICMCVQHKALPCHAHVGTRGALAAGTRLGQSPAKSCKPGACARRQRPHTVREGWRACGHLLQKQARPRAAARSSALSASLALRRAVSPGVLSNSHFQATGSLSKLTAEVASYGGLQQESKLTKNFAVQPSFHKLCKASLVDLGKLS